MLKLNGQHQALVYADYVNLLGDTRKKNAEPLTDASEEQKEKTKYMSMYRHQNAG
jgi:hypothetical protein